MAKRMSLVVLLAVGAVTALSLRGSIFSTQTQAQTMGGTKPQSRPVAFEKGQKWTSSFPDDKEFASRGKNPYFLLEPGYSQVFEGKEGGKKVALTITVLDQTEVVDGVETRVVEERETTDGDISEVSRNFIALSKRTNSVFYFGEDSTEYKSGKVTGHSGSWKAGANGAKPGMLIPGTILLGARFQQEIAPGIAMDRSEIVNMDNTVQTLAGTFLHCVTMQDSSPDEPGVKQAKVYAPGVGLVRDESLLLMKYGYPK